MKIVDLRIGKLKGCRVQSPTREEPDRALTVLLNQIRTQGVLVPLLVVQVGEHYIVADGHRRRACADILGLETLPCHVVEGWNPEELWGESGLGVRKRSGQDWAYGWAALREAPDVRAAFMKVCPLAVRSSIVSCVAIFGESRACEIFMLGKTAPASCARAYHAICGACAAREVSLPPKKQIGEWLYSHGCRGCSVGRRRRRRS